MLSFSEEQQKNAAVRSGEKNQERAERAKLPPPPPIYWDECIIRLRLILEERCNASTLTRAAAARLAQVWRKSCGVTFWIFVVATARVNHPLDDLGRGT
jgi:hypothetical protein